MDKINIKMPDFSQMQKAVQAFNTKLIDFFKRFPKNAADFFKSIPKWDLYKQIAGGSIVLGLVLIIAGVVLLFI